MATDLELQELEAEATREARQRPAPAQPPDLQQDRSAERERVSQQTETSIAREMELFREQSELARKRGEAREKALPAVEEAQRQVAGTAQAIPTPPTLPLPPDTRARPFLEGPGRPSQAIGEFLQSLSLLVAPLAGLIAGDGMTAANALNGAMQGWLAGDRERVGREMEAWQAATERVLAHSRLTHEHYQDILGAAQLNLDMKYKALEIAGLRYEDELLVKSAQAKEQEKLTQLLTTRLNHIDTLQARYEDMRMRWDLGTMREQRERAAQAAADRRHAEDVAQKEKELAERRRHNIAAETGAGAGGGQVFTPDAIEALAQRFVLTGELPGMGMGKAATAARTQVLNRVAEIMKETGTTPQDQTAKQAMYRAARDTLKTNTTRETLIRGFVNRIDLNIDTIRLLQKRYGQNEYGRMLNAAQNLIIEKTTGSGDLEALRLALISTSNEVAKIESGSLGIAGASDMQMRIMEKIHDWNLNSEDLEKVLQTSLDLGKNSIKAVAMENDRLKEIMAGKDVTTPKGGRTGATDPMGIR